MKTACRVVFLVGVVNGVIARLDHNQLILTSSIGVMLGSLGLYLMFIPKE